MKILICVDIQRDFVTGALANVEAEARIPDIIRKVMQREAEGYKIIFTQDTHNNGYLNTLEGKLLPVPHCIDGTQGHEIVPEVFNVVEQVRTIKKKYTFGDVTFPRLISEMAEMDTERADEIEEIELIGFVTSICVAANATILRASFPNIPIAVDASCCAGLTKEDHNAALTTLSCQQIEIRNWNKD